MIEVSSPCCSACSAVATMVESIDIIISASAMVAKAGPRRTVAGPALASRSGADEAAMGRGLAWRSQA
ncbi:hypothetical protein ACFSTJ_18860 [Ottowia pentelensis]|uniref:hypothetical protein n=1 Tax=Ottowia pentelensis TaxID=511108 RepID=UPI00362BA550